MGCTHRTSWGTWEWEGPGLPCSHGHDTGVKGYYHTLLHESASAHVSRRTVWPQCKEKGCENSHLLVAHGGEGRGHTFPSVPLFSKNFIPQ